jgi:hypothetical protein
LREGGGQSSDQLDRQVRQEEGEPDDVVSGSGVEDDHDLRICLAPLARLRQPGEEFAQLGGDRGDIVGRGEPQDVQWRGPGSWPRSPGLQ